MRTTGRQPHRRSKTLVIFIVAVIVLAAALTVGYFLWKQTQGVVKTGTVGGENETVSSSDQNTDRKSTRLNSSHRCTSRMPSSA